MVLVWQIRYGGNITHECRPISTIFCDAPLARKKKIMCITDMWKRQVGEQGTRWTTMEKWFDSWQGQEIYLSCKTFRLVQPTI